MTQEKNKTVRLSKLEGHEVFKDKVNKKRDDKTEVRSQVLAGVNDTCL